MPIFIAYLAACFAVIEFLDISSNRFAISDSTFNLLYILAAIGLPLAVILPWYINSKKQEITPDVSSLKSESSPIQEKSIIVLPFENISPDPDQEYFSDRLTEEIITDLSHIHELLVISRNSAMTFKGSGKTTKEIVEMVNVRSVNNLMKDPNNYPELLAKANHFAEKAIQVNPTSASTYYAQGLAFYQSCHPKEAFKSWKKAIAIEPTHSDPMLYLMLGFMYSATGLDLIEADKLLEKAKIVDPLTPLIKICQGWRLLFQGKFQNVVEEFAEWQNSLEQINSPFMIVGAWTHGLNQDFKEAFRIIEQLISNNPKQIMSSLGQFMKYSWMKEKHKALNTVSEVLEKAVWWDDAWSLIMAEGYAVLEESDKAFHFLDRAIKYGITNIPFLSEYDPFLENIRGEERFKKLMERVKVEWENFEV